MCRKCIRRVAPLSSGLNLGIIAFSLGKKTQMQGYDQNLKEGRDNLAFLQGVRPTTAYINANRYPFLTCLPVAEYEGT